MSDPRVARASARIAARVHRGLAEDIDRLRTDAGLTVAALARAAGVDPGYLHRILAGTQRPSYEIYARVAAALGADLVSRLYPDTGPLVRDRHQARMLEALLRVLHPRWRVFTEVAVRRPSRGWIDAVLHDPREGVAVAVEVQSELRRADRQRPVGRRGDRLGAGRRHSCPSGGGLPLVNAGRLDGRGATPRPRAPVAQRIERRPPEPKVAGSNPVGRATATFSGSASAKPCA